MPIKTVLFDEISLKDPLGFEKQGTLFSAEWRGELVAVKIFDATKAGEQEAFDKEVAAYMHLEQAWEELIPFPKFISLAFGVWFLGMQMASSGQLRPCRLGRCLGFARKGISLLTLGCVDRGPRRLLA